MNDSHYALNADPPTYTQKDINDMGELIDAISKDKIQLKTELMILRQEVDQIIKNMKAIRSLSRAFDGATNLYESTTYFHPVIEQLCTSSIKTVAEYHTAFPDTQTE